MKDYFNAMGKRTAFNRFISRCPKKARVSVWLPSGGMLDVIEAADNRVITKHSKVYCYEDDSQAPFNSFEKMQKIKAATQPPLRDHLYLINDNIANFNPPEEKINVAYPDLCGFLVKENVNLIDMLDTRMIPNMAEGGSFGITLSLRLRQENSCAGRLRALVEKKWNGYMATDFDIPQQFQNYLNQKNGRYEYNDKGKDTTVKRSAYANVSIVGALLAKHWDAEIFESAIYSDTNPMILISAHGLREYSNSSADRIRQKVATDIVQQINKFNHSDLDFSDLADEVINAGVTQPKSVYRRQHELAA